MKNEVNVGDLTPQQRLDLARGTEAAPVGEREAFEAWLAHELFREGMDSEHIQHYFSMNDKGAYHAKRAHDGWLAWQAAYQRAQQPQSAEAVAFVKESQYLLGDTSDEISELLPIGTKLYTTQQPSAEAGKVRIPFRLWDDPDAEFPPNYARGWNDASDYYAKLNDFPQPSAGVVMPEPYGWVAAGNFYTDREAAITAAGKTPCIEVYNRQQMAASERRSAERQGAAEELARLLNAEGKETRELLARLNGKEVGRG